MLRLFVLVLVATSSFVHADTELTQDEILGILKKLTANKAETWITSGVISANHEEYRAPRIEDANKVELEVEKSVNEFLQKSKIAKELEVIPFNTRYRLGNSYTMKTKEFVRFDGGKFYWQIKVDSRKDSIKPNQEDKINRFANYFDIDCNKVRVFAWDGKKETRYYNPCNQVVFENNPSNVNGPLTAGCIPWGLGHWSYEELKKCRLSASSNDKDEIQLNIQDDIYTRYLILDESLEYTVKSFQLKNKISGNDVYYNYSDYKKFSGGWVPQSIMIEKYENNRFCKRDVWAEITVDESGLSEDEFEVRIDSDAVINDCRFGSEVLRYIYSPTIPPEARKDEKRPLGTERTEYLAQKSETESNCATASVWFSSWKMGKKISLSEISSRVPIVKGQSSLEDMKKTIDSIDGLSAMAVNANFSDIAKLKKSQVILYLPVEKHFVNLVSIDKDQVCLADMNSQRYAYHICRGGLEKIWGGVALVISESNIEIQRQFACLNSNEMKEVCGAAAVVCHDCTVEQQASIDDNCVTQSYTCSGEKIKLYSLHRCVCENDNTCTIMSGSVLNKETWNCEKGTDMVCRSDGKYQALYTKTCEPIE